MPSPFRFPTLAALLLLLVASPSPAFDLDILGLQNEDFFLPPAIDNPVVNPSGKLIAYTKRGYDSEHIHILDIDSQSDRVLFRSADAEGIVNYIEWLDDKSILFQSGYGDIFHQDTESGFSTKLFDSDRVLLFRNAIVFSNFAIPRVVSTLPRDPKNILVSAFDPKGIRRVYEIPINGRAAKKLPKPLHPNEIGFDTWAADRDGDVRLAMKFSQKGSTLYLRESKKSKWEPFEALLGSKDNPIDLDVSKRNITQPRDYLLGFDYLPSRFFFASNRNTDTAAIYSIDLASDSPPTLIAYDPEYDLIDITNNNSAPLLSEKKKAWVGFHYLREKPSTYWIDQEYQTLQAEIDALLPESANVVYHWNFDETRIVVASVWSHRPTSYHLFDRENQTVSPIGEDTHPLAEIPGVPTEPIQIPTPDGNTLYGYYTPAKSPKTSPAPLVLLVHGGPWARDEFAYDPFVQCLANNGFATLRVNFRGSSGYGYRHFTAAAKDYGWAVMEDLKTARQWAIETNRASSDRIAVMGFSFGGYASALAAASQPDAFRCAIPISGIYDLVFETKQIRKQSKKGVTYEHWKTMVGSDWTDKDQLAAISPVNLASQIKIPLFIAHGSLDPTASVEHAHRFTESLDVAGLDYTYVELEEEAHSIDLPKNQSYLFDEIVDFLDTHLAN